MSKSVDTRIQYYELSNFQFQNGPTLPSARLAYLDINPEFTKVAVIQTAFRGRLNKTLNFADGVLRHHRIIVIALFGNGESASPSNTPGIPHTIDYRDCVHAQHELLTKHIGIQTVDLMLGFSMGGQCTYYWLVMYPGFVHRGAVIVCSSARTSRHNYQFLEGPRAALECAADFPLDKRDSENPVSPRGLRAFGKAYSAWLTSAEWFEKEEYKTIGFETQDEWDSVVAGANYDSWHPDDLLAMLGMWQKGNITACSIGSYDTPQQALSQIDVPVLLMPCQSDQYFRWEASQNEAHWITGATLAVIPSIWGHLAGAGSNVEDNEWMDAQIEHFLDMIN